VNRLPTILIILFLFPCLLFGQNKQIDSLNLVLKNAKHDTTRANTYNQLNAILSQSNFDTVSAISNKVFTLIKKNKGSLSQAEKRSFSINGAIAEQSLGYFYIVKGKYDSALIVLQKVLNTWKELGNETEMATVNNMLGITYYNRGQSQEAIKYFSDALNYQEKNKNWENVKASLINIGTLHRQQNLNTESIVYFKRALNIFESTNDRAGIARAYTDIGVAYFNMSKLNDASEYCQKSMNVNKELDNKNGLAINYSDMALIRAKQEKYELALELNREAMKLYEETKNISGQTNTIYQIGYTLFKLNKFTESKEYAILALKAAYLDGYPGKIKNAELLSSQVDHALKNYKTAFEHFGKYIIYRDSINNQETQKAAIKKQMQYTYEKQEEVAKAEHKSELEKQQAVADEISRKQKIVIFSVAIGLLLVIVFAGYVFKTLRATRKQKILIEYKNKEIEEKQKEILDSIHYAKRIQTALIPSDKYIEKSLNKLQKRG